MRIPVVVLLGLLLAAALAAPAAAQSDQFDRLLMQWDDTPVGSATEARAGVELRSWIEEAVGADALDAYQRYLAAEVGSEEEADALDRAVALAMESAGLRAGRAREMLEAYFFTEWHEETMAAAAVEMDTAAETDTVAAPAPARVSSVDDVELLLEPGTMAPGAPWTVVGRLRNNGDEVVYLAEDGATLQINPPLSRFITAEGMPQSLPATIPPGVRRISHEDRRWVAIPPATELPLSWHVPTSPGNAVGRYMASVLGPAPGTYNASSLVSFVFGLPRGQQPVRKTASVHVVVDSPVGAMLPFAWLGGLLVLVLQVVEFRPGKQKGLRPTLVELGRKLVPMIALIAIIIVISAGLEGIALLPHLSIETRLASVASGMLIQFLGYPYFSTVLNERTGGGAAPAGADAGGT